MACRDARNKKAKEKHSESKRFKLFEEKRKDLDRLIEICNKKKLLKVNNVKHKINDQIIEHQKNNIHSKKWKNNISELQSNSKDTEIIYN